MGKKIILKGGTRDGRDAYVLHGAYVQYPDQERYYITNAQDDEGRFIANACNPPVQKS